MSYRNALFAALAIAASLDAVAAGPARHRAVRTPPAAWAPQCTVVQGFPAVAMSTNAGQSVLPHQDTMELVQINTFGLAAAGSQNLIAVTGRVMLTSNDGGCSWNFDNRITFPDHGYRLVGAGALGTFAWSIYRPEIYFFTDAITQRTAPVAVPLNVHVDAHAPHQLAAADDHGAIWWSDDAGATWQPRAQAPARVPLYALAFSARGRMHAIASGLADGAHVTFDGGESWTRSAGLDGRNVFTLAFSPVNPDVVWAVTIDPLDPNKTRRAIFHSADGGRSFRSILAASDTLPLKNGFTLAPSPVNESLLYFALPGTTLYLINDEGTLLQRTEAEGRRDFDAILFSPLNPRVMYFGLKISDMSIE
jgi:photosystem II stability/assembly factor-like uncharacterized protein